MHVVLRDRRGDQEDQVDRLPVQRIIIYAILDDHSRKAGLDHRVALAVRDRDAFTDTGRGLFFSSVYFLPISLFVADLLTLEHQVDDLVDRFALGPGLAVQINTSLVQKICNIHFLSSFFHS